ncbi:MAG: hypothetical protein ACXWI9_23360 [Burkholderiales bacterium]
MAFLNAAYSAGEYLKQSISRENLFTVEALLKEPNIRFHRELRNTTDHSVRPEYLVTFEIHRLFGLKAPETFPHPDLRVAMSRGLVAVEAEPPRLGKVHLTYDRNALSREDARHLDAAVADLGIKENPSVVYMAERCYERLCSFVIVAADRGLFRGD